MYKFVIVVFVIVILISCDSANMFNSSTLEAPVVPGIYRTDCDGNSWGRWLNPYSPSYEFPNSNPNLWNITMQCTAYPNPDDGHLGISFYIPYEGSGKVTVVAALPPGSVQTNSIYYSNANFVNVEGGSVRTLFNDTFINCGHHTFVWDGRDDYGNKVADGFYRIYLEFDEYLLWVDMLLARDPNNIPPGLGMYGPESGTKK